MRDLGLSYGRIAEKLNLRIKFEVCSKKRWYAKTVREVLLRGMIEGDTTERLDKHDVRDGGRRLGDK